VDLPVPFAPTRPVRSLGVIEPVAPFEKEFVAEAFAGAGEFESWIVLA